MKGGLYNPRPVDDTPVDGQLAHGVTSNWAYDHAADFSVHMDGAFRLARTGEYGLCDYIGGYAITANQLYGAPFFLARAMTFDRIACHVTLAGGGGTTARMGIYALGTNLYPGALLLDAGTVSTATPGVKAITINQSLTKGYYFLALVSDGTSSLACMIIHPTTFLLGVSGTDFTIRQLLWRAAFTLAALPNPFTAGGALVTDLRGSPVVLRLLSLD